MLIGKKMMYEINFVKDLKNLIPLENGKSIDNENVLTINPKHVFHALNFLKNHVYTQYTCLTAISATDYPERKNRFEIAYELLSVYYNTRVRVKTFVNESTPLRSITSLFSAANWWEREIWDLYGVFFQHHPDLRRILTDYGFQGHPLRKDFPLSGYVEVLYDEKLKRVISQPLELTQEFRSFDFKSPWSSSFNNR